MIFLMKHPNITEQSHAQIKSTSRQIRKIRSKFWYWRVRARLEMKSSYAMGNFIEPHMTKKSFEEDGITYRRTITNNKCRRYALGVHPQPRFIEKMDEDVRGSKAEIKHRLWDEFIQIAAAPRLGLMDWPEEKRPWLLNAILHDDGNAITHGKFSFLTRRVRRSLGGPDVLDVVADVVKALGVSRQKPDVVESVLLDRLLAAAVLTLCADKKWQPAAVALFQYLSESVFCQHNDWVFGDDIIGFVMGISMRLENSRRSSGPASLRRIFDELLSQRLTTLEMIQTQSAADTQMTLLFPIT